FFVAVLPSPAQGPGGAVYSIALDQDNVFRVSREDEETKKTALFVTVQFKIHKLNPDGSKGAVTTEVPTEYIVVKENGQEVKRRKITRPRVEALTTVLALDTSGSMQMEGKMQQARDAALLFLDALDGGANSGLILFDHELREKVGPAQDK